jgi:hypothetical protein
MVSILHPTITTRPRNLSQALTRTTSLSQFYHPPIPTSKMASSHTTLTRLLTPLISTFRSLSLNTLPKPTTSMQTTRPFSSTPHPQAGLGGRPGGKGKGPPKDPRIKLIRYHMQHPKTPRPLKLSRMRALRHWTIHRAWMLARRKRAEKEEGELMRYIYYPPNALLYLLIWVEGIGDRGLSWGKG